jgi:hypothetical protein
MTTPTTAEPSIVIGNGGHPPIRRCWEDDDHWQRSRTRIELPSEKYLRAFWHAEILDFDSRNPHDRIIERRDPFLVRLRVELEGRLWRCICGHWCFKVGFAPIGKGENFDLNDLLPDPAELQLRDWKGCDTLCIDKCITVPPWTIPVERCGIVYEVAAWFELRCCGYCEDRDSHLAASGFDRIGEYMFV